MIVHVHQLVWMITLPKAGCSLNPCSRITLLRFRQCHHQMSTDGYVNKFSPRSYFIKCGEGNSCQVYGEEEGEQWRKKVRVLIAGGGIGGLVLALAAKHRGFEVKVFEKDLSAVRGEGLYRGPIQLASNAMAVLTKIDEDVAKQIMEQSCITGDRINGLADGHSAEWFAKFDLLTPAVKRGLPITRVICRMTLQNILVNAVGYNTVFNKSKVVDFIQDSNKVTLIREDGMQFEGDILVGADGIWSDVRSKLFGKKEAKYSGYTCYSGLTDYVPPYIDTVGYRVFLGSNQYFVASDVGSGKMQWYAFHNEPASNMDPPNGKRKRLLRLFESWCSEVVTLISETPEDMIFRRDIYDRDMISPWGVGRVTLLGDAAHPIQPNLGQGGCMAIEDCYRLILELDNVVERGSGVPMLYDLASALRRYEKKRMTRVTIVHRVSRIASEMIFSYPPSAISGSNLFLHMKHPAFYTARMCIQLCLPQFMNWLISGQR